MAMKAIDKRDRIQIVWLKRDLRLSDHAPLCAAAAAGPVLLLYMVEPTYWRLADSAPRHWAFIRESLIDLDARVQGLWGARIYLGLGEATDILTTLYGYFGGFSLWSHEETGNGWTFARDKAVARWARDHKVPWTECPANGVVRRLKSRDDWADRRDRVMQAPVLADPIALRPAPSLDRVHRSEDRAGLHPLPATRSDWERLEIALFGHVVGAALQPGGRASGQSVLDSFLSKRATGYLQTLSRPGVSARHCSRLSPHIAFGTLSVREIVQATLRRSLEAEVSGRPGPDARNLTAFASRLAWRCHFVQKLEQAPAIETHCMHPAFEGMRPPGDPNARLEAWIRGQT
ncbi:MAG: deoxyribodipyrimidine photo-lyase, partial [Asticcacaulis sp.]